MSEENIHVTADQLHESLPDTGDKVEAEVRQFLDEYNASKAAPLPEESDEAPELTDSELEAALNLFYKIQTKYAHKAATPQNLRSLAMECFERFADELGLIVYVDTFFSQLEGKPPQIIIEDRLTPFEHDRFVQEAKEGRLDAYWEKRKDLRKQNKKIDRLDL